MTDADPMADNQAPRAEFTREDPFSPTGLTESQETADHDGTPGVEGPVPARSGSTGAYPRRVGVVPPADWFRLAPEEAAPSGQPDSGPVRPAKRPEPAEYPVPQERVPQEYMGQE
jgi:hypothetical protein